MRLNNESVKFWLSMACDVWPCGKTLVGFWIDPTTIEAFSIMACLKTQLMPMISREKDFDTFD
jgi:hypothetical protein